MSVFSQNPDFFSQPYRLTPEHRQDPALFIQDFFSEFSLLECRTQLAILTRCALTGDMSDLETPTQRDAAWFFFEKMEELVEAVWVMKAYKK